MTEHVDLERAVAQGIADEGVNPPSDAFYDELLTRARHSGQRPEWLALIKENPMRTNSHVAVGSPTVRMAAVLTATLLVSLLVAGAGAAGARLLAADSAIVVAQDGSGDFTTIGEAVATAQNGDAIALMPGTYVEAVVVDKDIALRGEGAKEEIVLLAESGPIMTIVAGQASLSGITFQGPDSAGVHVIGGSPTFSNVRFQGVGPSAEPGGCARCLSLLISGPETMATVQESLFVDGGSISIESGANATIDDNILRSGPAINLGDVGDSVLVTSNTIEATLDQAIGVFSIGSPTIEGNIISAPGGDGITIDWSGVSGDSGATGVDPIIRDNTITGARTAINVLGRAAPSIIGNTIDENGTGIVVTHDALATITSNVLTDNKIGITVRSDVTLQDNKVQGGTAGIVVTTGPSRSASPVLIGNTVAGADRGIVLGRDTMPTLNGNHACDNDSNLVVDPSSEPTMKDNEICPDPPVGASE